MFYANKDQMKIWRAARYQGKDMEPSPLYNVVLKVEEVDGTFQAFLMASDGAQLVKRGISVDEGVDYDALEAQTVRVPAQAIAKAAKLMSGKDRAYFEGSQIKIISVYEDEQTRLEIRDVKGIIPFVEQTELDFGSDILESSLFERTKANTVTIDIKKLRTALDQFKHGSNNIWLHIVFNGPNQPLKLTAFEKLPGEQILSAIVPILED